MERQVFISRPSRHFLLFKKNGRNTFPYLYLELACKKIMLPAKEIVSIGETERLKNII